MTKDTNRKPLLPLNRGSVPDKGDVLGDEIHDTEFGLRANLLEIDVDQSDGGALEVYKIISRILGKKLPKDFKPRLNQLEMLICELGEKKMLLGRPDIKYTSDPGKVLTYLTRIGEFYRLKRGTYLYRPIKMSDVLSEHRWPPLNKLVFCLETALLLHYGSPRVPKQLHIAVSHTRVVPLGYQEVKVRRYTKAKVFSHGLEYVNIAGQPIQVYSRERTIADLLRFRNEDPERRQRATDALVAWWKQDAISLAKLEEAAQICRVWAILQPYVEMLKYIN